MSSSITKTPPFLLLLLFFVMLLSAAVEAQKPSSSSSSSSSSDDDWDDTANNASPSMAIVLIVLVLGFFITACIFIYIQHCSSSTTPTITASRAITNNTNTGLHQSLIDTFPLFQYSAVKELQLAKGALECAVCLSDFQDHETLRFLPNCDHVFHSDCIDTWLAAHHTCPVCRDDLIAVSDKPISSNEVQITIPSQDQTPSLQNNKGRLPRSHSTGHSLIQPGENCDRFTLRLPKEVRRQLLARAKLRTTSLLVLPRQSSSRRGYRPAAAAATAEGSGSSRYTRFFGRSFIIRMGSFRTTTKVGIDGDLTAPVQKPMDRALPV